MSYYATNPWTAPPPYREIDDDAYNFFLKWQDDIGALVAIWNAAGRREVLAMQRIINADIWDARSRAGTLCLSTWAECAALDLQLDMQHAVDAFACGCRNEALDLIDGMQDSISQAMDKAQDVEG